MAKLYSVLFGLALLCTPAILSAQQAETEEEKKVVVVKSDDDKKVVIIKKKINAEGEELIEKVVLKGDENYHIEADELEYHTDRVIEVKVEAGEHGEHDVIMWHDNELHEEHEGVERHVNVNVNESEGEKTITIEIDGDEEVIKLADGEALSEEKRAELAEKGVFIAGDGTADISKEDAFMYGYRVKGANDKIRFITDRLDEMNFDFDFDFDFDHAGTTRTFHMGGVNCVALGVFVNSGHHDALRITRTIDGSGAEEAGMQSGDVLTAIDGVPIETYKELHEALGAYEPGEVIEVTFDREGKSHTVSTELRAWGELPDYENSWRANVKCGDPDYMGEYDFLATPKVERKVIIIKKNRQVEEEAPVEEEVIEPRMYQDANLALQDFLAFPNPSDGRFTIEFRAEPLPLTVSVYDGSGRELYRDRMPYFNGVYRKQVDLTSAPKGPLVISVIQEGKQFTSQIIVQ